MIARRGRIAGLTITAAGMLVLGVVTVRAGAPPTGDGTREVRIVVHNSRCELPTVAVAPGETVRFVLENSDPIDHEFIVGDAQVQLAHERGTEAHHARPRFQLVRARRARPPGVWPAAATPLV